MIGRKESNRRWREKNKEHIKKYNEQYRKKESWKKYLKEYFKKWREANMEYHKDYYLKNRERIIEYHKQYWRSEPGKATNQRSHAKRRAREKEIVNNLTPDEWLDIIAEYKFRCAYCGKQFNLFDRPTRDHVIPISKGGHNIKENIVPACRKCNCIKKDKILKLEVK